MASGTFVWQPDGRGHFIFSPFSTGARGHLRLLRCGHFVCNL